jgi:hypothetical protein
MSYVERKFPKIFRAEFIYATEVRHLPKLSGQKPKAESQEPEAKSQKPRAKS